MNDSMEENELVQSRLVESVPKKPDTFSTTIKYLIILKKSSNLRTDCGPLKDFPAGI